MDELEMDGLLEDKEDAAMNDANGDLQPEPGFPGLSKPSSTLSSSETGQAKDDVKLDREQKSQDLARSQSKEEKANDEKDQISSAVSEQSQPASSSKSGRLQILSHEGVGCYS